MPKRGGKRGGRGKGSSPRGKVDLRAGGRNSAPPQPEGKAAAGAPSSWLRGLLREASFALAVAHLHFGRQGGERRDIPRRRSSRLFFLFFFFAPASGTCPARAHARPQSEGKTIGEQRTEERASEQARSWPARPEKNTAPPSDRLSSRLLHRSQAALTGVRLSFALASPGEEGWGGELAAWLSGEWEGGRVRKDAACRLSGL